MGYEVKDGTIGIEILERSDRTPEEIIRGLCHFRMKVYMISYVVPVFNEEESLVHFYDALMDVAPSLDKSFEIIFVDDGSTDRSLEILQSLANMASMLKCFLSGGIWGRRKRLLLGL